MGLNRQLANLPDAITTDTSNNVGIGGSPSGSYKFEVTGTSYHSAASTFGSTATATAFIPSGATIPTNGMYLSAANTLNFATNTTNRLTIASTGAATFSSSVGIGNPSTIEGVLTIQGTSAQPPTSGTTANSLLQLVGSLNNQLNIGSNTVAGSYGSYIQSSDNNLAVPYPLNLQPNGGQVLIGTYDGAVASNLVVAQDSSNILSIRRTTNSNTSNSRILFQANNVSGITQNVGIVECGLNSSASSSFLALYAGTTAVNLKIYENTGNISIGTTTDSGYKLAVASGHQYFGSGFQISGSFSAVDRQCATAFADFAGTSVTFDLASLFPRTTFTNRGLSVTMQLVALPTYTIVSSAFVVLGRTGNSNVWSNSILANININGAAINSVSASGTVITVNYSTYIFGTAYINIATIG